MPQRAHHPNVVRSNQQAHANQRRRNQQGQPATFAELFIDRDGQNQHAQQHRQKMGGQVPPPSWMLGAIADPKARHGELRERKREEHRNERSHRLLHTADIHQRQKARLAARSTSVCETPGDLGHRVKRGNGSDLES
jgi:hypothetical protein